MRNDYGLLSGTLHSCWMGCALLLCSDRPRVCLVVIVLRACSKLDQDHNGTITAEEVYHAMAVINPKSSKDEMKKMIGEVDVNGDGKLDYEEFLAFSTYHVCCGVDVVYAFVRRTVV